MSFEWLTTSAFLSFLGKLGADARYGFGFWLPSFTCLLFLAYKSGRNWLVACSLLFLCGGSLFGLWANASNEIQVLGGFLYFSDAAQYYADAVRLLEALPISAFSARHPLPTLFLGFWLQVAHGDLRWALLVLTVIGALCIFVAASSLARAAGPLAASLLATALFLFYRRFTGLPNSEQLGLALGCLSLAFLLHAASTGNSNVALVGLFLLGLGMAARPGTFLILFTILFWFIRKLRAPRSICSVNLYLGLVAVSMGVILTLFCNILLAEKDTTAFSNYAYSLYGMARGGLGWEQFSLDHPETLSMPTPRAEAIAFRESLLLLRGDSMLVLQGWMDSFRDYFAVGPASLYGFVADGETASFGHPESRSLQGVYVIVRLLLYVLSVLGMRVLWRGRANPVSSLLFWAALGAFLGLAFIPAQDAGMMRVHAVSLPYLLCVPAAGLTSVFRGKADSVTANSEGGLCKLLAGGLVLSILAGLVLPVGRSPLSPGSKEAIRCESKEVKMVIKMNHGSHLYVLEDTWAGNTPFPYVRYSALRVKIQQFHQSALIEELIHIPPNTILMIAVDVRTGQSAWFILPAAAKQMTGKTVEVCGVWNSGLLAKGLGFLQAERIYPFPSQ